MPQVNILTFWDAFHVRKLLTAHQPLFPAVHVDVDVLNPMILSVKQGARDIWIRLPPPVQQGLPYFAVGATTGMIVWKIQGGRLKREVGLLALVPIATLNAAPRKLALLCVAVELDCINLDFSLPFA